VTIVVAFVFLHRKREYTTESAPEWMENMIGDVRDKVAILVDDMIDTGKTLTLATRTLQDKGVKCVYALISHGLLSETNMTLIQQLPLEQLVVTNTIPQKQHAESCPKLVTIDVSPTVAESIRRTHNGESISLLFGEWGETSNVTVL